MNSKQAGITAQYGFHFQRLAYIYCILKYMSPDRTYIYEGCDDVEIDESKRNSDVLLSAVNLTTESKTEPKRAFQIKSGKVNKECWAKVIGNWLLLDLAKEQFDLRLITETPLSYDVYKESTVDYVVDYFIRHIDDKESSIARRVCNKYEIKDDLGRTLLKASVIDVTSKAKVVNKSHEEIDSEAERLYTESYCQDIRIYERAKKERFRRFKAEVNEKIEECLGKKESCVLTFNDVIRLITNIGGQIGDHRYTVDMSALHDKKRKQAKELLNDESLREVSELKKVDDRPAFVVRQLVYELFYKDLRDVYENRVSQVEYNAFSNHEDTVIDLDNPSPKEDFRATTAKILKSELFSDSDIYSNGCYIYMTSDEVPENRRITWGKSTEDGE